MKSTDTCVAKNSTKISDYKRGNPFKHLNVCDVLTDPNTQLIIPSAQPHQVFQTIEPFERDMSSFELQQSRVERIHNTLLSKRPACQLIKE